MHVSPRGEIYTFSTRDETFCLFYYEKHSFHPRLNLIFCLHVKNSLFHPELKFRKQYKYYKYNYL